MSLIEALKKKQSVTVTENGAKTFTTSLNNCLDLFFMAGASRNKSENEIISLFSKAYHEDKELAIKLLAYIRDCRGGMGERRFFRTAIKHLADSGYSTFNISLIPELGRWDDLFVLLDTKHKDEVLSFIGMHLDQGNALCAKWMPRQGKIANMIRKSLDDSNVTPKEYRKVLVELTKVVETQICNKEWGGIDYSHVPSVANVKYNKAFLRNDEDRRREFLAKAVSGEAKINSSAAFPHDIVKLITGTSGNGLTKNDTAIAMWNQLPNYLEGSNRNILPICDTSGSMNGLPLLISKSLGLYISERNEGVFKDGFITFSKEPVLQYTKGNLYERLSQMKAIHPANTDLERTFFIILDTAVKNKIAQKEMPTEILIISDMEFDQACARPNKTLYANIRTQYKKHNYEMPNIIFWNVNSRGNNVPIRFNEDGVGLISGAAPAVLTAVLSGNINPIDIMLRAVDKDKYKSFVV